MRQRRSAGVSERLTDGVLDQAFRGRYVPGSSAGSRDAARRLAEAVRAAAANPAGLLGLTDRGRLAAGLRADLVELDASSFAVRRVMRAGEWIAGSA